MAHVTDAVVVAAIAGTASATCALLGYLGIRANRKLNEIHVLVNSRMTDALNLISSMKAEMLHLPATPSREVLIGEAAKVTANNAAAAPVVPEVIGTIIAPKAGEG